MIFKSKDDKTLQGHNQNLQKLREILILLLLTRLSTYFEGRVTGSNPVLGVSYSRDILKEVRQFTRFFFQSSLSYSHVKVLICSAASFSKLVLLSWMFDVQDVG